jgi:hypothetical protein
MSGHITREKLVADLRRAIAEKGADYVYVDPTGQMAEQAWLGGATCVNYDKDGNPSCIIGHTLHYWKEEGLVTNWVNPDTGQVTNIPSYTANSNAFEAFTEIRDNCGVLVDEDAAELATLVQVNQDRGMAWGRALEEALEEFEAQSGSHHLNSLKVNAGWY